MGNSLMVGAAKLGLDFVACAPEKYFPDAALVEQCRAVAKTTGATLTFETDPKVAAAGADVIYSLPTTLTLYTSRHANLDSPKEV